MQKKVRIGCSSAFWGDSIGAASQLVKFGKIDYLVADYLAEVTMGILAKRRNSKSNLGGAGVGGYIAEFVTFVWKPLMKDIMSKKIRVVTNAGGLDPVALKTAIEEVAIQAEIDPPVVAAVCGDDMLSQLDDLKRNGSLKPFSQSTDYIRGTEFLPAEDKKVESLNAYLGAEAIARAFDEGAQIVVTGRCVDSAMVLGPLLYEFQWKMTDYNQLAAGSLAGHIIECGCQATGGNFTDWKLSAFSENGGWSNMGFPIVECYSDGSFITTKPDKTGGLVTVATVGEQMIYEIGDPASYILPDVIVDLRNVKLEQVGKDRVRVTNVKGRAPTPFLKVSGIYMDGYKVTGEIFIGGLQSREKALNVGKAIIARVKNMLNMFGMDDFRATNIEALGSEHTYGKYAITSNTRETVLRLSAHHDDVRALRIFLMEIAPSATCMAPGIIGVTSGRPRPTGNMVHFSCLVQKSVVKPRYFIGRSLKEISIPFKGYDEFKTPLVQNSLPVGSIETKESLITARLIDICYGRSGDKGDSANIGIICRDARFYPWLLSNLTESKVKSYMEYLLKPTSEVVRFEMPGIAAVNFLLTNCLGGGGLSSLQVDRQGKTFAQMVLSMPVKVPKSWITQTLTSKL